MPKECMFQRLQIPPKSGIRLIISPDPKKTVLSAQCSVQKGRLVMKSVVSVILRVAIVLVFFFLIIGY